MNLSMDQKIKVLELALEYPVTSSNSHTNVKTRFESLMDILDYNDNSMKYVFVNDIPKGEK